MEVTGLDYSILMLIHMLNYYHFLLISIGLFVNANISNAQCPNLHAACANAPTIIEVNNQSPPNFGTTTAFAFRVNSDARTQFIYLATELSAAGLTAGQVINGIRLRLNAFGPSCYPNSSVLMGHTNKNSFTNTSDFVNGLTVVASPFTYQINGSEFSSPIMYFDNPFVWNGTDNIVIEYVNTGCSGGATSDYRAFGGNGIDLRTIGRFAPSNCSFFLNRGSESYPAMQFVTCSAVVLNTVFESFELDYKKQFVALKWSLSPFDQEKQYAISILRSSDGITWKAIDNIMMDASLGLSSTYKDYDLTASTQFYYKLVLNELNQHSVVKAVTLDAQNPIQVFPNPTKSRLYIRTSVALEKESIQLHDILGEELPVRIHFNAEQDVVELDLSTLASGTYFLKLPNSLPRKIVKQ